MSLNLNLKTSCGYCGCKDTHHPYGINSFVIECNKCGSMWQDFPDRKSEPKICPKCKKGDKLNLNPANLVHHCSGCVASWDRNYFKGYNDAYRDFNISQNASDYSRSNHEPSLEVGRATTNTKQRVMPSDAME